MTATGDDDALIESETQRELEFELELELDVTLTTFDAPVSHRACTYLAPSV